MFKYWNTNVDLEKGTITLSDGRELTRSEASAVSGAYERMCTTEYIRDNHPKISQKKAWNIAEDVRDLMDDYGYSETEAIEEVLKRRN